MQKKNATDGKKLKNKSWLLCIEVVFFCHNSSDLREAEIKLVIKVKLREGFAMLLPLVCCDYAVFIPSFPF